MSPPRVSERVMGRLVEVSKSDLAFLLSSVKTQSTCFGARGFRRSSALKPENRERKQKKKKKKKQIKYLERQRLKTIEGRHNHEKHVSCRTRLLQQYGGCGIPKKFVSRVCPNPSPSQTGLRHSEHLNDLHP